MDGRGRNVAVGKVVGAKGSTKKLNTEMFDDVPVLRRKWQAEIGRAHV